MNRKTAWMLATWLPLAAAAVAESPTGAGGAAELILEQLPGEIGAEERRAATVVVSGDLAAVRLPSAIYLLERDAGAGRWRPVTRITAAGEAHFGDSLLLGSDTLLVAAPDTAGAGLGPGMAYVFQRHVGGSDHWGLVARLTPAAYPPPGAVQVRRLAPAAEAPEAGPEKEAAVSAPEPPAAAVAPSTEVESAEAPAAEAPAAEAEPTDDELPETEPVVEMPIPAEAPAAEAEPTDDELPETEPVVEMPIPAEATSVEATSAEATSAEAEPAAGDALRFIVVANMREKPRALALASSLRDQGYPSEVYLNDRGFFIVTLARLPRGEARTMRNQAVAAGDIPPDSYLVVGVGFRERISP